VLHSPCAHQRIGDLLDAIGTTFYGNHLETVVMVEVDMGCRKNRFMVVVLNARELLDEFAFMVIVNNRYRSYDFVVSAPFLLYERITHQVAEGLRAIAPPTLLGESQEAF
jgi:hypothetical protein